MYTDLLKAHYNVKNEQNRMNLLCSKNKTDNNCSRFAEKLKEAMEVKHFVARYYADTVVEIASDYNIRLIDEQIPLVKNKLENQGKSNLNLFLEIFYSHLLDYTKKANVNVEKWQEDCTNLQEQNFLKKGK